MDQFGLFACMVEFDMQIAISSVVSYTVHIHCAHDVRVSYRYIYAVNVVDFYLERIP
jgi:hypothetical protein